MKRFLTIRVNGSLINWAVINDEYEVLGVGEKEINNVNIKMDNLLWEYKKIIEQIDEQFGTIVDVLLCIPGAIDSESGKLVRKSRWLSIPEGTNLCELFKSKIDKNFYFINDANAAAIGSTIIGEAKNVTTSVYLINSTGVGLGLVINGKLILGSNNLLGEIGKLEMNGTTVETNLSYRTIMGKTMLITDEEIHDHNDVFRISKNDYRVENLINDWFKSFIRTVESIMLIYDPDLIQIESELLNQNHFSNEYLKEAFLNLTRDNEKTKTSIIKVGNSEKDKLLPLVGALKTYLEQ